MTEKFYQKVEEKEVLAEVIQADNYGTPFIDKRKQLVQVSKFHARSFAVEAVSGKAVWGDEFGTRFMSENLKGMPPNGEFPFLEVDRYSDYGVRTHWMCDTSDIERSSTVSDILRRHGLPTERIRDLSEVKEIKVGGRMMGMSDFKRLLYERTPMLGVSKQIFKDYVDQIDYFIIRRDVPVEERMSDLALAGMTSAQEFRRILAPTFTYLKMVDGIRLDVTRTKDALTYLVEVLPIRMGNYLGQYHNLGLAHGYPGGKNWILTGFLVDLDTTHGAPVKDKKIDDWDIGTDIDQSLEALEWIFPGIRKTKSAGYLLSLYGGNIQTMSKISTDAKLNFLNSYMETRHVDLKYVLDHTVHDFPELKQYE